MTVPVVLNIKTDGENLKGTFSSNHLGAGTIEEGSRKDNKVSFSIKIPQVTIKVWGNLKDGKLTGYFDAGQMKGKWEAKKK